MKFPSGWRLNEGKFQCKTCSRWVRAVGGLGKVKMADLFDLDGKKHVCPKRVRDATGDLLANCGDFEVKR